MSLLERGELGPEGFRTYGDLVEERDWRLEALVASQYQWPSEAEWPDGMIPTLGQIAGAIEPLSDQLLNIVVECQHRVAAEFRKDEVLRAYLSDPALFISDRIGEALNDQVSGSDLSTSTGWRAFLEITQQCWPNDEGTRAAICAAFMDFSILETLDQLGSASKTLVELRMIACRIIPLASRNVVRQALRGHVDLLICEKLKRLIDEGPIPRPFSSDDEQERELGLISRASSEEASALLGHHLGVLRGTIVELPFRSPYIL